MSWKEDGSGWLVAVIVAGRVLHIPDIHVRLARGKLVFFLPCHTQAHSASFRLSFVYVLRKNTISAVPSVVHIHGVVRTYVLTPCQYAYVV